MTDQEATQLALDAPVQGEVSPPMERGKVYESTGPRKERIAIMTFESWEDMGTGIETLRQALSNQKRLKDEAINNYEVAMRRLTDVTTRLENLRAVRRAEKRPEVEQELNNLGINTKG